jgi:hypothetical protein
VATGCLLAVVEWLLDVVVMSVVEFVANLFAPVGAWIGERRAGRRRPGREGDKTS